MRGFTVFEMLVFSFIHICCDIIICKIHTGCTRKICSYEMRKMNVYVCVHVCACMDIIARY